VVGERGLEAVGPGGEDDGIELPPGDHRGLRDRRFPGGIGSLSPSRRRASPVVGDARPDRSGPRVGIDDRFELALPYRLLPAAPIVVEPFEIQAHGLPVVGDEPIGPVQGVEVLVPELAQHRGIEPPLADPGIGRVEQGQRSDALRTAKREGLGDGGADVVGGHHHLGDPQPASRSSARISGVYPSAGGTSGLSESPNPRKSGAITSAVAERGARTRRQSYQKPGHPCSSRTG